MDPLSNVPWPLKPHVKVSPPRYVPAFLIGTIVGFLLLAQPPASSAQRWHASGMKQLTAGGQAAVPMTSAHMSWTSVMARQLRH